MGGLISRDLMAEICELIRITSIYLPALIDKRLRDGRNQETPGTATRGAMDTILKIVEMTQKNSMPICQDTGTPIFFLHHPKGMDINELVKNSAVCGNGDQKILPSTECR